MALEMLPIGTILAIVTEQVVKTALAAKDVIVEKESFKALSKYLLDIEPVLKELRQGTRLNDSPVARQAIEFLKADVKKAADLVDKYRDRARFYLLLKCRHIVKEVQEVTQDIGRSLAAFSLANVEALSGISERVDRLQNEMQRAEFETCPLKIQIIDKLNQGLAEQKLDQNFANDILEDIARAVGVAVEPSQIGREMERFRREKEEAENRKERAEAFMLEQVIDLLSQADAARDYKQLKDRYLQRLSVIEQYDSSERECYIEPFKAFICGITKAVMVDPVSLCNGRAYERYALDARFESGDKTDPETGDPLEDCSYRSNHQLRRSIQEWKEVNYCMTIRWCTTKLLSGVESSMAEALARMQELVKEDAINKDWVSIGGLTELIIAILGSSYTEDVKTQVLITLKNVAERHPRNKELLFEKHGFEHIAPCLGCGQDVPIMAVNLLHELLQDGSGWFCSRVRELSGHVDVISSLVAVAKGSEREPAGKAEEILVKLCDVDEGNILKAAKAEWFKPLTDQIIQGSSSTSRVSLVKLLLSLELEERNLKLLGQEGIIPALLEMVSTNLEAKEVSFSLLVRLSGCRDNKRIVAANGGVPLILDLVCGSRLPTRIIFNCCEILERFSSEGDGIEFLVDQNGGQLELDPTVAKLLDFLHLPNYCHILRRPALLALLGMCRCEARLIKTAVLSANGVSRILPLLDDSDISIREAAINLLFLFSNHDPQGVAEYLLKPKRLEALIVLLENPEKPEIQKATAGLLANIPKSETTLTRKLIELGGVRAIVNILRLGTDEAKEHALSALFRFTDPTNLESQKVVVQLGTYPLLLNFLKEGSVVSKARAAALIGDLSMRTRELLVESEGKARCSCFNFRTGTARCPAHGGICSVGSTFCLVEAKALPELVRLLHGQVHETAYEAIQTLSTLVYEESPKRGARVLHDYDTILPVLEILNWGSESLKVEALGLLEKVFKSTEMVDHYGLTARSYLVRLTGHAFHEEGHLQRKAARVLLLIERYSRSSRSLVSGLSL